MSEQSGPITREQVERLIAALPRHPSDVLGLDWIDCAPDYVTEAWEAPLCSSGLNGDRKAALERWRDELAAAEPVRRVARWDAYALAYAAKNADGAVHYYQNADRAKADGYEIEGGPEPIQPAEDSPERLRERREALGWTTAYAGHWVPWFDHTDVERAESGKGIPAFVARYAAALSAEEERLAELAEEERLACAYRGSDGTLVWDDSPLPEPERPAPRGWTRHSSGSYWCLHCNATGDAPGGQDCANCGGLGWRGEPGATPERAPEVVDVPQPVVIRKRLAGSEHSAAWSSDEPDVVTLYIRSAGEDAPLALLRAMLAAIDAQQGGAS